MKEFIMKAHEISQGATRRYLEHVKKTRAEVGKALTDSKLSEEGRRLKANEIRRERGRELMGLAKKVKAEYREELSKAKQHAQKVLDASTKKPDQSTIDKFDASLEDLKVRVMLSTNPQTSKRLIEEFAQSVEDPYFANRIKGEFAALTGNVIGQLSGPEALKVKRELASIYDDITERSYSAEQLEAKQIAEQVDTIINNDLFSVGVIESARDTFGASYAATINNPDEFVEETATEDSDQFGYARV